MQISEYDAPNVFKLGYEYSADGRLQNVLGMSDVKLDRKVSYDHVGRLAAILTANDTQLHSTSEYLQADSTVPLKRTYSNDAFDNFSFSRERDWNTYESDYSASYSNNRAASLIRTVNSQTTTTTQGFDSAGEVITTGTQQYLRDALGRVISEGLDYPNATTFYDGDGQLAKDKNGYYLRSSVLGGKVVEKISNAGQRKERLIYVGGALNATQTLDDPNITNDFEVLTWQIRDPHHTAERNASIKTGDTQYSIYSAYVFDGLGNGVGAVTGTQMAQFWSGQSGANYWNSLSGADFYAKGRDAGAPSYTAYRPLGGADCRMDGVTANCDDVLRALSNGSADLIHLSTPNPFLGIGMVSLTSRFYRSQTDVKIPGAIDNSGGASGGNDGSFVEWDWVGRGQGIGDGFESPPEQQSSQTRSDPLQRLDSAGRHCKPSEMTTIYLMNRSANLYDEPIPHTWLQVPSGSWGFGPYGMYREGEGHVYESNDRKKYRSDVTISYDACPDSVAILEKAIKDNNTGWYVYNNRPFPVKRPSFHLWKENGDLFDIRIKVDHAGLNCTGWACKMLEIAGFTPPVPSSRPNIGPGYKKR